MKTNRDSEDDDIVSFPVPRKHLGAVVKALAEAMSLNPAHAAAAAAVAPQPQARSGPYPTVPWTKDELSLLKQLLAGRPAPLAMFNLAAKRPGQAISFEEIYKSAKVSRESARAAFAGLTQLVRRRFNRGNWPIGWEWATAGTTASYRMTPEVAALWNEL
jgi:hypothetical protein